MTRPKVLIFDDVLYDYPERFPMPQGVDVRILRHADDVLAEVQTYVPALIFMDQNLGGLLQGTEAVQKLVSAGGAGLAPIYGCSSVRSSNQEMVRLGAAGWVSKGEIAGFILAWLQADGG